MNTETWPDRALHPFESRYLEMEAGRVHYVDEGSGPVLLMVHGTPTWSFLYRRLIRELSQDHRVVAFDHLGFGLSDRPSDWGYRPEDHARILTSLIERLGLEQVTLVVHDFGGPIGLSYAIRQPANVRALVLFNTWMWSLGGTPAERLGRLMGSAFGRVLYERFNFSPRVLIPMAFGDRRKLSKPVHRQYVGAFANASERRAPWVLARELVGSREWYEALWHQRATLAGKPALLLWGMKDPAFGADSLARWKAALPHARSVEYRDAGHFVQEEAPEGAAREIRAFVAALQ